MYLKDSLYSYKLELLLFLFQPLLVSCFDWRIAYVRSLIVFVAPFTAAVGQMQQLVSSGQVQQLVSNGQVQQLVSGGQVQQLMSSGQVQQLVSGGQMQQLVSGGQVLQILSAPPSSGPVSVSIPASNQAQYTTVTAPSRPVAAARSKQPQLRPKPANSNANPVQNATPR